MNNTHQDSSPSHSHAAIKDQRNADILICINGEIFPREKAVISVFDSGFVLGDGVWEGLRLHDGAIPFIDQHFDRLYAGAKTIDLDIGKSRDALRDEIKFVLNQNKMYDGVHIRLMVTRGIKSTPYQDPRVTIGPATIVIIPEYKSPDIGVYDRGLSLFTVHVRRTAPDMLDQKINSHSKLNCITACIQATKAGADEALMLDDAGAVATCNSTHFFIIKEGEILTSDGLYCLGGITRKTVLNICKKLNIPARECRFSLSDVYGASGAFTTGTFAGIVKVRSVDGRAIDYSQESIDIMAAISQAYQDLVMSAEKIL